MAKTNVSPRISVNKLGEYIVSKAGRQRAILHELKYPPEYITTFYKDAQESISQFIAGNMEDYGILDRTVTLLHQRQPKNIYEGRQINGNIEAIETFATLIDDIDLQGADVSLGAHTAPKLQIRNVQISVRPDIVLIGTGTKSKKLVGGIKLHFPKSNPLSSEAGGYVSCAMQLFCDHHLSNHGLAHHKYCMTIDVGGSSVHGGVSAVAQRRKDIEAACEQINALWPTI